MNEAGEAIIKLHWVDWIVIAAYIGGLLWLGFYFSRRKQTFDDYFMAGRNVPAPLLVGTLVSTFYGLDTLLGTAEVGYFEGVSAFFAYALPYAVFYVILALLSPKFKARWPHGSTMQDIVFARYGKVAGVASSVAAFVYSTNSMEMMGIGFLIRLITGWPLWVGVLIGAGIALIYTYYGGLWADIMTDFVQFCVMMITVGVGVILAWHALGGFDGLVQGLKAFTGEEDVGHYFSPGAGYLTTWTLISYSLTALVVLAEPAFFQRIFASATPRDIKVALASGVPMWISFDWAAAFLGLLGAAAVGLGLIPEVAPNEVPYAVLGTFLPVGLVGLGFAGALAAAMSTADSYFLISGGVIGYDLQKVWRPQATDKQKERWTKNGILISAALSIGLSLVFDKIMGVWVFQATVMICTSLIPVYFGTFSRRPPKKISGTLATVLGLGLSILWYAATLIFGYNDEEIGTQIIKVGNVELWQEYGIIMIVPLVFVIYVVSNLLGKKTHEQEVSGEVRA
ncbi:MAG: sodium:solute symporter family protein [Thermoleophilia bacterium]|nr:sodium:solute symporter family protein [Thermoleophilia bacterium]